MDTRHGPRHNAAAVETSERAARILVIEDDDGIQTLMRDVLTAIGHKVFVASNGRQGLAYYRDCHPDLVITDIFMPERDGLDVILELAPDDVKIIATSGGGEIDRSDHLDDAIYFGARRALAKPFTVDALIEAVETTLAT